MKLNGNAKKLVMVAVVATVCVASTFAAGGSGIKALDSFGDRLIALCTSNWLKAILAVMLMVSIGVAAYGNSQGSSQMVTNGLRWAIGTAVILAGTSVVNYFFNGIQMESLSYAIENASEAVSGMTCLMPPLA